MNTWLGWAATAVFACSYFVRNPSRMRLVQAAASIFWILDGVVIHATPIIVANVIVATLAMILQRCEDLKWLSQLPQSE